MLHRRITALAGATAAATTLGLVAAAAPATAAPKPGDRSLVTVLDADGNRLDRKWGDFDIVHKAATTVLGAKPDSAVGVLADGGAAVTAFLPTDRAFRKLVRQVGGTRQQLKSERAVFNAVASTFDVDTIETVLLYHVVPDATVTYHQALRADGAALDTAAGAPIRVNKRGHQVYLRDVDTNDANPRVLRRTRDLNKGNAQIAHGINRVLRPVDLP
jgi:uncharacterized surface protein with fasciclin (FAS1) repeats